MKISRLIGIVVLVSIFLMFSLGMAKVAEWKMMIPMKESSPIGVTLPDNMSLSDVIAMSNNTTILDIKATADIMAVDDNATMGDNMTLSINLTVPMKITIPMERIEAELATKSASRVFKIDSRNITKKIAADCWMQCFSAENGASDCMRQCGGEGLGIQPEPPIVPDEPDDNVCIKQMGPCMPDLESSTGYSKTFINTKCEMTTRECRPR